jgi:hypothetical protein
MRRLFLMTLAAVSIASAVYLTAGIVQAGHRDGSRGRAHSSGHSLGSWHHGNRSFRTFHFRSVRSHRLHFAGRHAFRHHIASLHRLHLRHPGTYTAMKRRHNVLRASTSPIQHHNRFWNRKFGADRFAQRWSHGRHRHYRYGWVGPVFWPYAYGDIFSYALWPYDYDDDVFWDYGPDMIVWGAFWPYGEPIYGYDEFAVAPYDIYGGYRIARRQQAAGEQRVVTGACQGFAPGVTDLPLRRFEQIVKPTDQQRPAFEDLQTASDRAAGIMKESCPAEIPLTPVSRLDAMAKRLMAMDNAAKTVRGPLERFYASLSDEQKQQLDKAAARRGKAENVLPCSSAGVTSVPAAGIETALKLDDKQQAELAKLKQVSAKAADAMKASCPASIPSSPAARLDAVQQRVAALLEAVDTVRPAVRDFYASLTDEQKAQFNVKGMPAH